MRLDIFLVKNGIFSSRIKAQEAISEGLVKVNGKEVYKSSFQLTGDEKIEADYPDSMRYVSRGGLKLEKALKSFKLTPKGKFILDAGASHGGFTDCLLQNGAEKILAVDVGEKQLHPSLANNPRITSIEKLNIKDLTIEYLDDEMPDWIVADLSFISLTQVFKVFSELLKEDGLIVTLIKPQFEAGRENINKGGIVKSARAHKNVLKDISAKAKEHNLFLNKIDFAPIYDDGKNIEYLGLFSRQPSKVPDINIVVEAAFGNK